MLKSLIEWFDRQLLDRGVVAVVRSALAILGISVTVAAVFGVPTVKIAALATGAVLALAFALVLLRDRARLLRESESYQELLSRYCHFIASGPKPPYRVSNWHQVAVVHENGDVDEELDIELVTVRKEIYFLQFKFGPGWEQPARYWKRMTFEIHLLQDNGARVPDSEVTHSWDPRGSVRVTYHLHAPVPNGTKLHLQISWHWPGKAIPLMRRRTDLFFFNFTKAFPIDRVSYVIVLPRGFDAYSSPYGFYGDEPAFEISSQKHQDRHEFMFEATNAPLGRRVGMRLQLK